MEFMSTICLFLVVILTYFLIVFLLKFLYSAQTKLPLPPGTMGWPYIGETFQLYSQNPNVFFASKVKKLVQNLHFVLFFLHHILNLVFNASQLILEDATTSLRKLQLIVNAQSSPISVAWGLGNSSKHYSFGSFTSNYSSRNNLPHVQVMLLKSIFDQEPAMCTILIIG